MPTDEQVHVYVITVIAGFAQLQPSVIDTPSGLKCKLKDAPLAFDDNKLAFLAMSLRGYIKHYNNKATITASDLRKDGVTVADTIKLVGDRIKS